MIKVVFMGTPKYAEIILQKLIDDSKIEVLSVFTQPDRAVGRKKVLTPPDVKKAALEHSLEVKQPQKLRDKESIDYLKKLNPDFIIVAAYGQLLPKEILDIAPCINLHASILPLYRGASPIQQALLNQDEYSGVTAMLMDVGLDTGDILGFNFIKSSKAPTLPLMTDALSHMAATLTINILKEFNNINPLPQINAKATKCKKIKREDGLIEFNDASSIYSMFCAYYGWPGLFIKSGLKIHDIELVDSSSSNNKGEILEIVNDSIIVGCKKGSIKISQLQPPSKAKMSAKSYILGKRIKVGDNLL